MKRNIEGIDVHHLFASMRVNKIMGDNKSKKNMLEIEREEKL